MYYKNRVKHHTHWAYYWAWIISSKAVGTVETVAMALRSHHTASDVRMYDEGIPVSWFTGPPFIFRKDLLLALNIGTPDHYAYRKKENVTGWY